MFHTVGTCNNSMPHQKESIFKTIPLQLIIHLTTHYWLDILLQAVPSSALGSGRGWADQEGRQMGHPV